MGAPLDPATAAHVSFVSSLTQPDPAVRPSELVDANLTEKEVGIRKRPSIIIGADVHALAAVRLVHSPRSASRSSSSSTPATLTSTPSSSSKIRGAWRRKLFASGWTGPTEVILSLVGLVATLVYYGLFLRANEARTDVPTLASLSDPILPYLPTLDCSAALSVLVYGSLVAAFKYTYNKPDMFLEFVQTHALVIWVRMLTLYLTPLEAPIGTVPLVDPIAYPDGAVLVRDLFFSGHTATTFALFIGIRRHDRLWKVVFGFVTLFTAVGVLLQKAHYTIDVVAAPFFVNAVHSLVVTARRTIGTALAMPDKHQAAKGFYRSPTTITKPKQF